MHKTQGLDFEGQRERCGTAVSLPAPGLEWPGHFHGMPVGAGGGSRAMNEDKLGGEDLCGRWR